MAVTKEYRCLAHGNFESRSNSPKCPQGCSTVERVFLTPPSIRTNGDMTSMDKLKDGVAASFGMTDMNNRDGHAVMQHRPAANQPFNADNFMAGMMNGQMSGPMFAPVESASGFAKMAPSMNSEVPMMPSIADTGLVQPAIGGGFVPAAKVEFRGNKEDSAKVSQLANSMSE